MQAQNLVAGMAMGAVALSLTYVKAEGLNAPSDG